MPTIERIVDIHHIVQCELDCFENCYALVEVAQCLGMFRLIVEHAEPLIWFTKRVISPAYNRTDAEHQVVQAYRTEPDDPACVAGVIGNVFGVQRIHKGFVQSLRLEQKTMRCCCDIEVLPVNEFYNSAYPIEKYDLLFIPFVISIQSNRLHTTNTKRQRFLSLIA